MHCPLHEREVVANQNNVARSPSDHLNGDDGPSSSDARGHFERLSILKRVLEEQHWNLIEDEHDQWLRPS